MSVRPSFPAIDMPHLAATPLPPVHRVGLVHPDRPPVEDVAGKVAAELRRSKRLAELPAGSEVALAVGSRGIADIAVVAKAAIDTLKAMGFAPFIVPAMGSHGGGTAEGQVAVLEKLGVSEALGAPVRSSMETVSLGRVAAGVESRFDKNAAAAPAIVTIARVRSHTSFDRPVESGLCKILAVGLGKAEGARNVHRLGVVGYTDVLPQLAAHALANAPVAYGIALVENARKKLAHIEGVEPENWVATDERLLKLAKSLLARLPFAQIDALIVQYLGKELSGAGMDYAVTGRTDIRGVANPPKPFVHKLAALRLTEKTAGNAVGLGVADYIPQEFANGIDLAATYLNSITSTMPNKAAIPMVLKDEETVIKACLATCWRLDPENARYCQIHSTAYLDEILVSPAMLPELEAIEGIRIDRTAQPLEFEHGRLATWL